MEWVLPIGVVTYIVLTLWLYRYLKTHLPWDESNGTLHELALFGFSLFLVIPFLIVFFFKTTD